MSERTLTDHEVCELIMGLIRDGLAQQDVPSMGDLAQAAYALGWQERGKRGANTVLEYPLLPVDKDFSLLEARRVLAAAIEKADEGGE